MGVEATLLTMVHPLCYAACSHRRELVKSTKRHLGGGAGDDSSQAVGWEGSSAWIADQFQLHFEAVVTAAAGYDMETCLVVYVAWCG